MWFSAGTFLSLSKELKTVTASKQEQEEASQAWICIPVSGRGASE